MILLKDITLVIFLTLVLLLVLAAKITVHAAKILERKLESGR